MHETLVTPALSLGLGFYFFALTVGLGVAALPEKLILARHAHFWNYLAAWVVGFNILSACMAILGLLRMIDTRVLTTANLLFLGFLVMRRARLCRFYRQTRECIQRPTVNFRTICLGLPVFIILLVLFFSTFVPHTKADELAYHMYFVKHAATEGAIGPVYSPSQMLFFMSWQTYNIWPYIFGAEYAPSLNSFAVCMLSLIIVFGWSKQNFGSRAALWCAALAAACTVRATTAIAAGDSAANILLTLGLCLLSYDLWTIIFDARTGEQLSDDACRKLFLLSLVSVTAMTVKIVSIVLIVPLVLCISAGMIFRGLKVNRTYWLAIAATSIVLIVFSVKQCILYRNPLFPMMTSMLGSGPFDPAALRAGMDNVLARSECSPRTLPGLLYSPLAYLPVAFLLAQANPMYWLMVLGGLIKLSTRRYFAIIGCFLACYGAAFFAFPHVFFRFYWGAVDFLMILGVSHMHAASHRRISENARALWKFVATGSIYVMSIAIVFYSSQFIAGLFSTDQHTFIRPRVQCYDTIRWINRHLEAGDRILVETRQRYYYDPPTHGLRPTVLGESRDILEDPEQFRDLLVAHGITHMLAVNPDRPSRYHRFLATSQHARRVYYDEEEIVQGYRTRPPRYGSVAVYELIPAR
jgi:hypothetical protein